MALSCAGGSPDEVPSGGLVVVPAGHIRGRRPEHSDEPLEAPEGFVARGDYPPRYKQGCGNSWGLAGRLAGLVRVVLIPD